MTYPEILTPNDKEVIILLSGKEVDIPKTSPLFQAWTGQQLDDRYGNKPLLNLHDQPAFAELVILDALQSEGWDGVWVDTYRRKYRTSCNPLNEITLPSKQQELLNSIYQRAGSRNGCWDVFCWKENSYLFAESKRHRRDHIRDSQMRWLEAALESDTGSLSFLVVKWSIEEIK